MLFLYSTLSKLKLFSITAFLVVNFSNLNAQGTQDLSLLKQARRSWGNLNFQLSQQQYEGAIEANSENFDANFELGIFTLEVHNDYEASLGYFEKALSVMPKDTVYEVFKYLGEVHQYVGNYVEAKSFYKRFYKAVVKDEKLKAEIDLKINQCEFASSKHPSLWDGKFVNMGNLVNSESSEYCSVLPQKDSFLLFTKRSTESLNGKDAIISMEDIYFSKQKNRIYRSSDKSKELSEFSNLSGTGEYHNAIVNISPSGDSLILYRNNLLWTSTYQGREWSTPVKMPKTINIGRNQRHACFSPDGNTIIFSSNAKNGQGGYDLYFSSRDSSGNWGLSKNLGNIINSAGNEDSPFISKDGSRLYFSSTGHMGYGKFDVFYSEWIDTAWSKPINAGTPINSPADDIYFHIVNDQSETSLLSSSRKGGFGQMDLYYFYKYGQSKFENCISLSSQNVLSDSLNELTEYVMIAGPDTTFTNQENIFSPDTFCIKDSITHVFWRYDSVQITQKELKLIFDSTQLESHEISLEVLTRDAENEEHRFCVTKQVSVAKEIIQPVIVPRTIRDSNEMALSIGSKLKDGDMESLPDGFKLELESVYFSFNKSDIRKDQRAIMDANIKMIKENPNMVVKIIGHTDKVGSNEYNLKLSQKRAKSAVKYLTNKGVSINQIVAVLSSGEEEAGARYKNEDGTDDVEKMEVSRRVDFFVIGTLKK